MDWAAVYNTDISGNEVRISGFHCLTAGLSGNFTGTDAAIGDMAVPFYLYAKAESVALAGLTIAAFFVLLAEIIVQVVALIKNNAIFTLIAAGLGLALGVLLVLCHSTGISMNDAQILHTYCSDNPACSIRSDAILPALLAFFSLALPVAETVKRCQLKKKLG